MTDLVIKQGTDPDIRIPDVRDASGTLITNWAGFSVKGQIRSRVDSATVLHEWSSQADPATAAFVDSDVVLTMAHASSSLWAFRSARYDVELTDPQGRVARLASGWVVVDPEVTR